MNQKNAVIFLHRNLFQDLIFVDPRDICAVLSLNWTLDAAASGIPPELVEKMYDDYQGLTLSKATTNQALRFLYIYPEDPNPPLQLLRAISLMNEFPEAEFTIYAHEPVITKLRTYTNQRIKFMCRTDGKSRQVTIADTYHAVITLRPGAIHFMKQGMPVIIIGPRGFGG